MLLKFVEATFRVPQPQSNGGNSSHISQLVQDDKKPPSQRHYSSEPEIIEVKQGRINFTPRKGGGLYFFRTLGEMATKSSFRLFRRTSF